MKYFLLGLALAMSFVAFDLSAQEKEDKKIEPLHMGKEESVPSQGVKMKVFKDAQARPIPTVGAAGYFYNKATGEHGEDFYHPQSLWFADQCIIMWECKSAKIYLAKMLQPPPSEDKFTKAKYNEWKQSAKMTEDGADKTAWLSTFAGEELDGAPKPFKAANFGVEIVEYPLKSGLSADKALFIASNSKDSEQTYVILYDLKNDKEPAKNARKVIEQSMSSIAFFQEKEGSETPKQMPVSESKRKKDWSEKYIQSREEVVNNLKNLKGWWYLETDNFIIASDITKKPAITSIQNQIEANRQVYAKLFPLLRPVDAVSVVRVFNKRDEYISYVPKGVDFSVGVWMSSKKEFAISSTEEWAKGTKGLDLMLGTIAHEGFHQYVYYAAGQTTSAPWFNEGTARVFNNLKIKPTGKFDVDMPEYVYDYVKEAMKSPSANLSKLIGMDYDEFYESKTIQNNYACANALMYFLYKGAPAIKGCEAYAEIPGRYYKTLCETHSIQKAQSAAFEGVDMKALEKSWKDFWESSSQYNKSKNYEMKPVIEAQDPASAK